MYGVRGLSEKLDSTRYSWLRAKAGREKALPPSRSERRGDVKIGA